MRKELKSILAVIMLLCVTANSLWIDSGVKAEQAMTASNSNEVVQLAEGLYNSKTENLAGGKNGYASSNQRTGVTTPIKVSYLTNENITGTNYIITHQDDTNPWFCVDLGTTYDINKVIANQGAEATYPNAYATEYVVEYTDYTDDLQGDSDSERAAYISGGAIEWKTAATVTEAKLGVNTTVFESVNTRYVRVRALDKYDTCVSLYEMYVYETDYSSEYVEETTVPITSNMKILFIGNSLTYYNDVALKVKNIFAKKGVDVTYDTLIQLGQTLEYHYSLAVTGSTILNGDYDYIVLQDKASGFDGNTLMSAVDLLYNEYISKTNAKMVMYMPWANESTLLSKQQYMTDSYLAVAQKYDIPFAAAGEAWFDLYYNYGYDFYSDNIHADNTGSFVSANAIYYAISGDTNAVVYNTNDTVISSNGYDLTVANLISERACYYVTMANQNLNGYKSIAEGFVPPETTTVEKETVESGDLTAGTVVDSSVFTAEDNIAVGKNAYASSQTQAAKNAVDKNTNTRWESKSEDPQWIYVDLEGEYYINKVGFQWEGAYATKYHVQVSDIGGTAGANWTTVKTVTATSAATVQIDMGGVKARYVRMFGESRGTQYGYSIYEFGVWGSLASYQADTENLDVEGFQLKTSYDENGMASPGYRVIMRVGDDSIDGAEVSSRGIIIMYEGNYSKELMVTDLGDIDGTELDENKVNENGALIAVAKADPITWSSNKYDDTNASYYSFLMVNNVNENNVVDSLNADYYVRSFARLANGTIVYSPIYKSSIYSSADALYQGKQMSSETAHNYLYDNILSVVKADYEMVEYAWSNILHKPECE